MKPLLPHACMLRRLSCVHTLPPDRLMLTACDSRSMQQRPSRMCYPAGCMDAAKSGGCSSSNQPSRRLLPDHSEGLGCGGSRNHLPCCSVVWGYCVHGVSVQNGQAGERHTTVMAGTCCSSLSVKSVEKLLVWPHAPDNLCESCTIPVQLASTVLFALSSMVEERVFW